MGTADLLAETVATPDTSDRPLSAREREVAGLTGQGLSNEQISRALHISRRTVETHLEHVRQKLDLGSRHEVMAWALPPTGPAEAHSLQLVINPLEPAESLIQKNGLTAPDSR